MERRGEDALDLRDLDPGEAGRERPDTRAVQCVRDRHGEILLERHEPPEHPQARGARCTDARPLLVRGGGPRAHKGGLRLDRALARGRAVGGPLHAGRAPAGRQHARGDGRGAVQRQGGEVAKEQNSRMHHERFPGLERALKAPLRDMANSPCWSVVGQGCGFQVFSVGSRQMSVNVSRCTLPTHTPFVPFTVVRGRGILRSSTVYASFATIGANTSVGNVEKGGSALVKRFVTLVTVALAGAAMVTQWQRVKDLGRQVLSRRAEKVSVSANENKATVRRIPDEVFNQGNLSMVDELLAPDYVLHDPGVPGGQLRGLEAFKEQWVSMLRTAFPDLRIVIEDQVAEGDKVVSRYTGSGTHQGELRGFPPTNNRVEVTGTITSRFAEGKIVEEWNNFDNMGMMQQLGIVPPLEPQGA